MQHARLYQTEIGEQRAHLGQVLDPAHQIALRRVVLVDHGGALGVAVIDDDPVVTQERGRAARAGWRVSRRLSGGGLSALAARRVHEAGDVVDHVGLNRVEVGDRASQRLVLLAHRIDQMSDREIRDLAVDLADFLAPRLVPARDLLDGFLKLLLKLLNGVLRPRALGLGQLAEVLGAHHFLAAHRREGEPHRCPDQRDLAGAGALLQLFEGLGLTLAELFVDALQPGAVLLAVEDRGNRGLQFLDQPRHVAVKFAAGARRKFQRLGPMRVLEIVDVAPIGGRFLMGRLAVQELAHGGVLAQRVGSEREQVEAVRADADTEAQRLDGPLLAQNVVEVIEFGGRAGTAAIEDRSVV